MTCTDKPGSPPRRTLLGEVIAFALVLLPLAALIEWRG